MSLFAKNFRHVLGLHNCTQQRAAELLDVSRSTVANWVTGKKEPSLSTMIKISEVFEVDAVRLAQLSFYDLLQELLDRGRFIRVDTRIEGTNLEAIAFFDGPLEKVVPMHDRE